MTNKFTVTLQFDVEIDSIDVPDQSAFTKLGTDKKKADKLFDENKLRQAMKDKGMTDEETDKAIKGIKSGKGKGPAKDYQMLLYPVYEEWAAAQVALQQQILADDDLCNDYVLEMVRDLTRGNIDRIIDEECGEPDLNDVLKRALTTLPDNMQTVLKAGEEALLHDETELVDDSVNCRFAGISINRS